MQSNAALVCVFPFHSTRNLLAVFSTALLAVLLQRAAAQIRLPPGYNSRRIPCDSVLVQLRPSDFPHCKCTYGDWSNWEYEEHVDDASGKCPSGRKFILKQTRSPLSSSCPDGPQTNRSEVCEYTLLSEPLATQCNTGTHMLS